MRSKLQYEEVFMGEKLTLLHVYQIKQTNNYLWHLTVGVDCVCYKGSQYVSNSNAVYDLFLTSAVTDGLKLWDLRSNRSSSPPDFSTLINYHYNSTSVICDHSCDQPHYIAERDDVVDVCRCVRRYDGHVNRVHGCSAEISPCCRYVAAGSEDKCVRICLMLLLCC